MLTKLIKMFFLFILLTSLFYDARKLKKRTRNPKLKQIQKLFSFSIGDLGELPISSKKGITIPTYPSINKFYQNMFQLQLSISPIEKTLFEFIKKVLAEYNYDNVNIYVVGGWVRDKVLLLLNFNRYLEENQMT
jgi:hypothetical protein